MCVLLFSSDDYERGLCQSQGHSCPPRLLDNLHMAFIIAFIYHITIVDYGSVSDGVWQWTNYMWPLAWSITLANLNISLVQVRVSHTCSQISTDVLNHRAFLHTEYTVSLEDGTLQLYHGF